MIITFTTKNGEDWNDSQRVVLAVRQMIELCNLNKDRPVLAYGYQNSTGKSGMDMALQVAKTKKFPTEIFEKPIEHQLLVYGDEPYLSHLLLSVRILTDQFREE